MNPAVPAELETIILKATEKNPAERYATAQELADDLERFLKDEPIRARRTTLTGRLRKWARRHQPIVWSAAISAVVLLVLAVATLAVSNVWVTLERNQKDNALKEKDEALLQGKVSAKAAVANSKKARDAVDQMLTEVGQTELAGVPRMEPVRRALLEKALKFYLEFLDEDSRDLSLRLETAKARQRVASIYQQLGRSEQAEKAYHDAIGMLEQLVAEFPSEPDCHAVLAETCHLRAIILTFGLGRHTEAEIMLRRALALRERLAAEYPNVGDYRSGRAGSLDLLAVTFFHRGRHQEAEEGHRQALAVSEKVLADFPGVPEFRRQKAFIQWALAGVLHKCPLEAERHYREALKLFLEAPGDDTAQSVSTVYLGLGNLLRDSGRPQEAEETFRQALMLTEKLVVDFPASPGYLQGQAHIALEFGRFLAAEKRPQEAEAAYRRVLDIQEKLVREEITVMPSGHYILLSTQNELVALLKSAGRHQEAEIVYRRAVDFFEKLVTDHRAVVEYQRELVTARKNLDAFLKDRK